LEIGRLPFDAKTLLDMGKPPRPAQSRADRNAPLFNAIVTLLEKFRLRGGIPVLTDWRCTLIEFGGEADHVHLVVGIHPALNLSTLINNLKSASSRRRRNRFADHLATVYWKPYFWHRAYLLGASVNPHWRR